VLSNHLPATAAIVISLYLLLKHEQGWARFAAGVCAGMAVSLDLPCAAFAGAACFAFAITDRRALIMFLPGVLVPVVAQTAINYVAFDTMKPIYAQFGGPWYEYEGSHWLKLRQTPLPKGIDFLDQPKHVYAFHLTLGHHGLLSLTPIFVLALGGMFASFGKGIAKVLPLLFPAVILVVVGFYVFKTNNYGGWTCGPRWLFWLTPLFLLPLIRVADQLSVSRAGRGIAWLCLAISVFSVNYCGTNPWRHPWMLQWFHYMGWVDYFERAA
jgi:hypothetical protein